MPGFEDPSDFEDDFEDNTTPLENPQENASEIQEVEANDVVISNGASEIDEVLESGVNIGEDGVFVEPSCSICKSPYREELEEAWLSTRMVSAVVKVFEEKGTKKVPSTFVIENHMVNHLGHSSIAEIQRREYTTRIKSIKKDGLSTLDQIAMMSSMITENILNVNSITPSGNETKADIAKLKSAETTKLVARLESLCKLRASILGEMLGEGDLIYLPTEEFVKIFNRAIVDNQGKPEVQEAIKNLLGDLQNIGKSN